MQKHSGSILTISATEDNAALRALSVPARVNILRLLCSNGPRNVNDIASALGLPQSSVAVGVRILEEAGLVNTKALKARKGYQKICSSVYDGILVRFKDVQVERDEEIFEVSMPIGLYMSCETHMPCGLRSKEGVIGVPDSPDCFFDPQRIQACLLWFDRGYVQYEFPNASQTHSKKVYAIEFSMEMASGFPGSAAGKSTDIGVAINSVAIGKWKLPNEDNETLRGRKVGKPKFPTLITWLTTDEGTFVNGTAVSSVTIDELAICQKHSVCLRIEIKDEDQPAGGVSVFGRGLGQYNHDILMRISTMGN